MQRWKQSARNAVRELGRGLRGSTAVRAGRWLGSQFRHGEPCTTSRKSMCRGNHRPARSLMLGGWERLPNGSSFLTLSPFRMDSDSGASSVPGPALPAAEAAQGKSPLPTAHPDPRAPGALSKLGSLLSETHLPSTASLFRSSFLDHLTPQLPRHCSCFQRILWKEFPPLLGLESKWLCLHTPSFQASPATSILAFPGQGIQWFSFFLESPDSCFPPGSALLVPNTTPEGPSARSLLSPARFL